MNSFIEVRMLLYLVLWSVLVAARAVVFSDCGSAYDLRHVDIEGCGQQLPCHVTLGDRISVKIDFYADFESRSLDQDVIININYVHARTPVTPEQCESEMCPVRKDAVSTLTSIMSVPTKMALNQRGYLTWRVYNEQGKQVLCYFVMVQTQTYVQKMIRPFITQLNDIRDNTMALNRSNFKITWNQNLKPRNQTAFELTVSKIT